MTRIETFEDLDTWLNARQINNNIYQITRTQAFQDDYALNQIRKAKHLHQFKHCRQRATDEKPPPNPSDFYTLPKDPSPK